MFKKILHKIDRSFDAGNRENFLLNEFLLVISVFLLFIAGLHFLEQFHFISITPHLSHIIHIIELVFGALFLIEFALRTIYVYIPDKKFFTLFPLIHALVIISLLAPEVFNLAFLRILWIIKMFKIYHMQHETHRLIAQNPTVTQKPQKPKRLASDSPFL